MSLSFFLEMGWKSAFIALVALLLAALLRSRAPADRAAVLQVGLALILLLPFASFFLPVLQVEMGGAVDAQPMVGTLLQLEDAAPALNGSAAMQARAVEAPLGTWAALADAAPIVALLYLLGLAVTAARLLAGLATLQRWTSESQAVSCSDWTSALARVAASTGRSDVALRVHAEVASPLSWGWMKPVILIDAESLRRGEDAEAIVAHEMAHIMRRDWPALMLSRIAMALFWFNPLVWLVGRAFVRHAEEAADCRALAQVEPAPYAQALLGCASHASRRAIPANSIATSDLSKRVHAILRDSGRAIPPGSWLCGATILGCLALAGPVSAMKLIPRAAATAVESLAPIAPKASAIVRRVIAPSPALTASPQPAPVAPVEAPEVPAAVVAAAAPDPVAPAGPVRLALAAAEPVAPKPASLQLASLAAPVVADAAQKDDRTSYEAAMREARAANAELARAAERAAKAGEAAAVIARRQARQSIAQGAVNMENGAENMQHGARQMADEAVKLRDPAYRERQIAREASRGRTVTHQQLIDAIPQLEKGSRDMIKGAEDMRRGAEQMRRGADKQ